MMDAAMNRQLSFPPSVVSRADVSRLISEIERVDNQIEANETRSKVGASPVSAPSLSPQLSDFATLNQLELAAERSRAAVMDQLRRLKDDLPVIHMTFATEADPDSLAELAQWLRASVHPLAVIDVGLQPGLVAGVYLRTNNRVFDLSLKGALHDNRDVLAKELRALRGA